VSNVVDISNYVLMEWSQPLHFFDAAKLRGGRIVVRPAIPGEAITAIDGKEYELNADRLVIADGGGVVAIAGVMGGIESEVSDATRDILIESAAFSAPSVRRTSRELALASESSYRFERFVDPALSERASLRAAVLLAELADGEIAPGVVDVGAPLGDRPPAALRWSQIRRLLGVDVPREKVRSYFEGLDLEIRREDDTSIEVRPPSWRVDLEREADLLEEVARIHGFDVVPAETSMPVRSPRRSPMDRTIEAARSFLVGAGLHEIVTLNLVREGVAANPPVWTDREPLEVRNPVRAGEGFLRRSLLGSLLAAADLNRDRGREGIRLFEIAAIDLPREGGGEPEERTVVSILLEDDYAGIVGLGGALLEVLGHRGAIDIRPSTGGGFFRPGYGSRGVREERTVVHFGEVEPSLSRHEESRFAVAEIDLEAFLRPEDAAEVRHVRPSRFPEVRRDLSVVVDEAVTWARLWGVVASLRVPDVQEIRFFDVYRGDQVGTGKKSLAFTIVFRSEERTLTGKEVDGRMTDVVEALEEEVGAILRA
jgi:phenylalanyl-tRNA synthetase beta chain